LVIALFVLFYLVMYCLTPSKKGQTMQLPS
jgi:hypothetical protein